MNARIYLSTTIPYVNARPHLGFALELVEADVLARIAAALAAFDVRAATAAIWDVVEEANRYVELAEPWRLAKAERDGDAGAGRRLDASPALLVRTCAELSRELAPFLPGLVARIQAACDGSAGRLPAARPVFPRIG